MERLDGGCAVGRRDADALVDDLDGQPARRPTERGHPDGAGPGAYRGVVDDVLEDLADPDRVDLDGRQIRRQGDFEPVRTAGDGQIRAQTGDQRGQLHRRALQDQGVGLELGDVEDLGDQRPEPVCQLVDPFEEALALGRCQVEEAGSRRNP